MSASTVSITAAAPARRRPVISGEKKSNLDFTADAAADVDIAQPSAAGNDGGAVRIAAATTSRDLSHHSVLERSSKEQKKSGANTATVNGTGLPPRRSRKSVAKPEKPRWLTVVSILTKNLTILIVLVGLVQLARRYAVGSREPGLSGLSEIEGRIAEVEMFTKKTANLMQVQMDVVDRQVKEGIGGLRDELGRKIKERNGALEETVMKVKARSEELEQIVGELKSEEVLLKRDLDKVVEELKKNVKNEIVGDLSLDDVRAYVKGLVEKEIEKHAADGLGRVDYALATGGGMVVKHSEPYVVGKVGNWFLKGGRNGVHSEAEKILKPSFGEPGQCFPLKGSSGFVEIRLRTAIFAEAVTLEHVAKSVAYDRSSAPKDCRVSGWLQGHDLDKSTDDGKMSLLTEFTYDLEKSNAQTFNVLDSATLGVINTVRLDFTSNHGSPSHTCIYRFRVHGREPASASLTTMQS